MHSIRSSGDGQPALQVTLARSDDGEPVRMAVHGELDAVSADRLQDAVTDLLSQQRPRRITMDMAGVTFLDSAGVRALLRCATEADRATCAFSLTGLQPPVRRVLHITGLLEHFGLREPRPPKGAGPAWTAIPRARRA